MLDLPPQQATRDGGGTGPALRPRPVTAQSRAAEPVGVEQSAHNQRLDQLGLVAAALALLRGRRGPPRIGRAGPAVHGRPALHPVDRVEQGGPLGEPGFEIEEGVGLVDGVVDRPPLAALVSEHGVVAGPDPAVAVHGQERCAADGRVEKRVALAVHERSERAGRASDEHAVAGQCTVAAVGGRGEEVVVAAPADDVGALVAVADRDPGVIGGVRGRRRHAGRGEVHVGGEHAAVVRAVVEDALVGDRVAEDVRVERPPVRAAPLRVRSTLGVETGRDDGFVGERPRTGRAVPDRDADGTVAITGVRATAGCGRLGDRDEQVVLVGGAGIDDLWSPERGGRVDPGGDVTAVEREGVADVGPVHQVGGDHRRDPVEDRLAAGVDVRVVQRVGGAVQVPDLLAAPSLAVLALDDRGVGAAVDRPVTRNVRRERVLVAGLDRPGGGSARAGAHRPGDEGHGHGGEQWREQRRSAPSSPVGPWRPAGVNLLIFVDQDNS